MSNGHDDKDKAPIEKLTLKGWFSYRRGTWWPLWALFLVPFMFVFWPLYKWVRAEVNWKAAWISVLIFEVILMIAESYAIKRGHWVYNENRIFGPKVFGVPIEEPLLYYLFCPLMVICIYHGYRKRFAKQEGSRG